MIHVENSKQAKSLLIETDMDIVVIDVIPGQDAGIALATELTRSRSTGFGTILLMRRDELERSRYQTERMGIVTLQKPLDGHLLTQTIHLLLNFQLRIQKLQSQTEILQHKLEDDRLINRAKLLLVEKLKMSEEEAHRYLEQSAMDACVKKVKVAREIIRKYSGKHAK